MTAAGEALLTWAAFRGARVLRNSAAQRRGERAGGAWGALTHARWHAVRIEAWLWLTASIRARVCEGAQAARTAGCEVSTERWGVCECNGACSGAMQSPIGA